MFYIWLWIICIQYSLAQFAYDDEGAEEILEHLRTNLNAKTFRRIRGGMGGGCINTGQGFIINNTLWVQIKCNYNDKVKELECSEITPFGFQQGEMQIFNTDKYGKIFVKICPNKDVARPMFEGELYGLNLLRSLNIPGVTIAKPYKVIDLPQWKGGACLVLEYFTDTSVLNQSKKKQMQVGKALAYLHLYNQKMKKENPKKYISKFGFDIPTYCGRIPQDNSWKDNWLDFFIKNRIEYQLHLLKDKGDDQEPYSLWHFKLKQHIPKLFENINVEPSLLHGDLWCNNVGLNMKTREAYMYDPACFYGHDEYDLAIAKMFAGYDQEFYDAYHEVIPKKPGFDMRQKLYKIFHYLNHWNQYGIGYYYNTVDTMKDLCFDLKLKGVDYKKIDDEFKDYNRIAPNKDRPIYIRTKNTNKASLYNTTRKRGNNSKRINKNLLSTTTKIKTSYIRTSKIYEDKTKPTLNEKSTMTTLSLKQIYQIFYAQEGYNWKKKRK